MTDKKSLREFVVGTVGMVEADYDKIEHIAIAASLMKDNTGKTIVIGTPPRSETKNYKMIDYPPMDYGRSASHIIVDDPIEYEKLDYKARYKRVGDMVRDTETGELIPLRKLAKNIKRELGIR